MSAVSTPIPSPLALLLTVGTDFHPFDRLIDWTEQWLACHPDIASNTLIQHGTSRSMQFGRAHSLVAYPELQAAMRSARVVVAHGGPATVLEVRRHGSTPICVPRDPRRGEHIDDHQLRFASYLATAGMITMCTTKMAYHDALNDTLTVSGRPNPLGNTTPIPDGVGGLADAVASAIGPLRR